MLDRSEAAAVAEQFGVSDEQVRRDHLLSHPVANRLAGAVWSGLKAARLKVALS